MRHITIDFETRSEADLKALGPWNYAAHPTTEILMLAIKVNDEDPLIWLPTSTAAQGLQLAQMYSHRKTITGNEMFALLHDGDVKIEAHNAEFELAMWHHVMHKRHGFPDLHLSSVYCSAAKAAACSIPRSLGEACSVLGLPQQKDKEGSAIMMRFCKPQKKRKGGKTTSYWHWDDAEFEKLCDYCLQDVNAERALSLALPDLNATEREVWKLDQIINRRGIRVDVEAARAMVAEISKCEAELLLEWRRLTNGRVSSPKQVQATIDYLSEEFGVDLEDMRKQTIIEALDEIDTIDWTKLDERCADKRYRRILEVRQAMSKASTAKYQALLKGVAPDGRIRSLLMYHGASTGRWTAKRFQPQNLPSRGLLIESDDVEEAIHAAKAGALGLVWDDTMSAASSCIRGMLIPSEGHRFICADYSAIEGRVLAWLAGEQHVIDAYVKGLRLYCVAAAGIYKLPYDEIEKGRKHDPKYKMMDAIGKVVELACGYQGGVGAFSSMAGNYGVKVPDSEAKEAIYAWRESRPNTVALWKGLDAAAFEAVSNPGVLTAYGMIRFKVVGKFLMMRLPSKRLLYYYDPQIVEKEMPWTDDAGNPVMKPCVSYMGTDSYTHKWTRQFGYGGKWTENAVQAIARDLMAFAMLGLEEAGYPVVLTVHDEVLCDVPCGHGSVEHFCKIMTNTPSWAAGCPVSAEGWEGMRYKK